MEETKVQETTGGGQEPQNQQQTAAAGAQPGQEPAAEQFDAEYVRKLRAEAAEYRKRLRELEQKAQEQENAKLSETERLQKRLAELEREQAAYQRERQERTLKYETMLAASRLGIVDPDAAYRLLDVASIEFAEDGTPKNLEAALKELVFQSSPGGEAGRYQRLGFDPDVERAKREAGGRQLAEGLLTAFDRGER